MWNLSIETAATIQALSTLASVAAGVLTVGAIIVGAWASGVIDKHSDEQIAEANKLGAQANAAAALAKERTEQLVIRNSELSLELEKERNERLKLQTSLGPRSLRPDQLQTLFSLLGPLKGKSRVRIQVMRQDPEVSSYAHELQSAFVAAGIAVDFVSTDTIMIVSGAAMGVVVVLCDGPGSEIIGTALTDAEISRNISRSPPDSPATMKNRLGALYDRGAIAANISVFPKAPHL